MKRIFTGIVLMLASLVSSFAQWQDISPSDASAIFCLDALNENIAVVGAASSFITKDGGTSWQSIFTDAGILMDIELVSEETIVAVSVSSNYAAIVRSVDGGSTWSEVWSDTNRTKCLNYVEFFDEMNGVVMGDNSVFLHTTDGGASWFEKGEANISNISSGNLWYRLDFVNDNVGYIFAHFWGEDSTAFLKTVDGGVNWEAQDIPEVSQLVRVSFYNEDIGVICGSDNTVYTTTDGGQSWVEKLSLANWCMDVEFDPVDSNKFWMSEFGVAYLLNTVDFGETTESYSIPFQQSWFVDVKCVGDDVVFAAEQDGKVFRTLNGGVTGVETEEELPADMNLSQNYPNPFNPSTTIKFSMPVQGNVSLKLYDMLGREVKTLLDDVREAGKHEVRIDMSNMASGVYYYRLESEGVSLTRKMMLVK